VKVEASTVAAGHEKTQSEISGSVRKRQVSSLEQSRNGAELGVERGAIRKPHRERKVSACRAICRPSRSVKRQGWSNPSAARSARSRARSNSSAATSTWHRQGSNPEPGRSSQVLSTKQFVGGTTQGEAGGAIYPRRRALAPGGESNRRLVRGDGSRVRSNLLTTERAKCRARSNLRLARLRSRGRQLGRNCR